MRTTSLRHIQHCGNPMITNLRIGCQADIIVKWKVLTRWGLAGTVPPVASPFRWPPSRWIGSQISCAVQFRYALTSTQAPTNEAPACRTRPCQHVPMLCAPPVTARSARTVPLASQRPKEARHPFHRHRFGQKRDITKANRPRDQRHPPVQPPRPSPGSARRSRRRIAGSSPPPPSQRCSSPA